MKVALANYQILSRVLLEFPVGLTALIGPTNNGKSSILRGIESVIYNRGGTDFISTLYGDDKAGGKITYNNHTVAWKKSFKGTVYQVDGKTLPKPGRGQLPEVRDALGIGEVKLLDSKERINFWKEKKPPFLMDKSPSQLFEFLSLSSEDDNLTLVIKKMRSDLNDINSSITKYEGQIDSYKVMIAEANDFLNTMDGFDSLYSQIISLDTDVQEFEKLDKSVDSLVTLAREIKKDTDELTSLSSLLTKTEFDMKKGQLLCNRLRSLDAQITSLQEQDKEIKKLQIDLDTVDKKISSLNLSKIEQDVNDYVSKKTMFDNLNTEVESLVSLVRDIQKDQQELNKLQEMYEDVKRELSQYKTCPLCGSDIAHNHNKESVAV